MRCAVIARHRDEYRVRLMCRVLGVSVSGFYAYPRRPLAWRRVIDEVLLATCASRSRRAARRTAPRACCRGYTPGLPTSEKRVARLMREAGLKARPRRARRLATTDSMHPEPIAPNRLARQFDVNGVGLDRVWVGDLAYLPTREGPLYLAAVLDLGSRRCVGWDMRDTMEVDLVVSALRMGRAARHPAPGLLVHSDRGRQYASGAYRAELARHGMQASMSRKGNCYDNAVAESLLLMPEFELVMRADWRTREEARTAVFEYLETWYNPKRRHSTLGYLSPSAYEEQLQRAA